MFFTKGYMKHGIIVMNLKRKKLRESEKQNIKLYCITKYKQQIFLIQFYHL